MEPTLINFSDEAASQAAAAQNAGDAELRNNDLQDRANGGANGTSVGASWSSSSAIAGTSQNMNPPDGM
jgi:hypothetical protein